MDTTTQTSTTKSDTETVEATAMLASKHDMRDALLMASLGANVFVLTLWVAMQVTTAYDGVVLGFLK